MSILDATEPDDSLTKGLRALDLFVGRARLIRQFAGYLNDNPPKLQILFFSGDGGNGKSLLLRYLRERCWAVLDSAAWQALRSVDDDAEFVERYIRVPDKVSLPYAYLDFGLQPRDYDRPQEPMSALLMLRRALAQYGLRFPRFDFAILWYLYSIGQFERYKALFRDIELDLLENVGKHYGDQVDKTNFARRQGGKIAESDINSIQRMDPQTELIDSLPHWFAHDLNEAMTFEGAPRRLVLFFDSHDAFREERSDARFFERDEWLRHLLVRLELVSGIVVVIAGRERPRWTEAHVHSIPARYIDHFPVGPLTDREARHYLAKAHIDDPAVQTKLLEFAHVAPQQIHPLALGLGTDAVLAAVRKGTDLQAADFVSLPQLGDKVKLLIQQLLRWVDSDVAFAIRALSACRTFDKEIYYALASSLHYRATAASFAQLTRLSFVWRMEGPENTRYRIHDLLRRLLREQGEPVLQQADQLLESYYSNLATIGDTVAIAEAIYHANHLDWVRSVIEWTTTFDQATELGRYDICEALMEIRREFHVKDDLWNGRIAVAVGGYFVAQARYVEAERELQAACVNYDRALVLASDDPASYAGRGSAQLLLGHLYVGQADLVAAQASYAGALADYDRALALAPDVPSVLSARGDILLRLGDLEAETSTYPAAEERYSLALAAYDQVLALAPDFLAAQVGRGDVWKKSGDVARKQLDWTTAENYYQRALDIYARLSLRDRQNSTAYLLREVLTASPLVVQKEEHCNMVMRFLQNGNVSPVKINVENLIVVAAEDRLRQYVPVSVAITQSASADDAIGNLFPSQSNSSKKSVERIGLLFYAEPPDTATLLELTRVRLRDHFIVIPIPLAEVALMVSEPSSCAGCLAKYIDRYLPGANLFDDRGALGDTMAFFGRTELISQLRTELLRGESIGVFGLRKSGKTSILLQVSYILRQQPIVHIDLQVFGGKKRFGVEIFNAILQRLVTLAENRALTPIPTVVYLDSQCSAAEGSTDFLRLLDQMADVLSQVGYGMPIVCLIDEIERILPNTYHQREYVEEFNAFWGALRAFSQRDRRLSLLIADVHPDCNRINQWPHAGVPTNPVFSYFKEVHIEPFSKDQTITMIDNIGKLMGRTYEHDTLVGISEASGGHPFLARQLASLLYQKIPKQGDTPLVWSEAKYYIEQQSLRSSGIIRDYFAQNIWADIKKREFRSAMETLYAFACNNNSWLGEADLSALLSERYTEDQRLEALDWLVLTGLIYRNTTKASEEYQIRVPLLSRWIQAQLTEEETSRWLLP